MHNIFGKSGCFLGTLSSQLFNSEYPVYVNKLPFGSKTYFVCAALSCQIMAAKVHLFTVEMSCEGCSGAVERVLNRLKGKGVEDISIDLKGQQVAVTSSLGSEELLEVIKKTGKTTTYIGEKS